MVNLSSLESTDLYWIIKEKVTYDFNFHHKWTEKSSSIQLLEVYTIGVEVTIGN
jgi:hypothetical protein